MTIRGGNGQSLSVLPDDVREVGQYVYGIAEALKTALDSASREVEALLSGGWNGDLASEFGAAWTETSDGGNAICTALTEMAEKLGVTADTFRNRDTTNSADLEIVGLDLPEL